MGNIVSNREALDAKDINDLSIEFVERFGSPEKAIVMLGESLKTILAVSGSAAAALNSERGCLVFSETQFGIDGIKR